MFLVSSPDLLTAFLTATQVQRLGYVLFVLGMFLVTLSLVLKAGKS